MHAIVDRNRGLINKIPTGILVTAVVLMMVVIPSIAKTTMFSVDAASFRMPEDWAYLEVYTLVPRHILRYELVIQKSDTSDKSDTLFEASLQLICSILSNGNSLISDTVDAVDQIPDTALITSAQSLPQVFPFHIRAGTYTLQCQMIDRKRGIGDITENELVIPDYPDDQLSISDMELAIRMEREEGTSKFHKNGYLIYPNPQNVYGESLPRLMYYAEVYNLNFQKEHSGLYYVNTEVLDSQKNVLRSYERKIKPIAGPSMVEVGGFPVTTYTSGVYFLKLTVTDSSNGAKASRFKKFYVFHPSEIAVRSVTESGETTTRIVFPTDYSTLDTSQVEKALEDITYLLTPGDERQLKKLNLEGRRTFLSQFWTSRDPDPSTKENEARTEHYRRLGGADQLYGYLDIPGWKTDRGRIWILYGRPDTEESHPMEIDAKAYKIWYYDKLEGGVMFVFVDKSGFGNFELVHSTKRGEVSNTDWYSKEVQGYRTRDRGQDFAPLDADPFKRGE
jgi:GWxTD domain-containing protein